MKRFVLIVLAVSACHLSAEENDVAPNSQSQTADASLGGVPKGTDDQAEEVKVQASKESRVGSRMAVPLKDLPATVNVITRDDLQKRGATEWVGALRYTSGITPLFTYGGFNSATIRGMQENDMVVLLDGMRDDIYNQVWSTPQSNLVGVDSIEVLKGPNSMLYGVGALAGVIQKTRKRPSASPGYELGMGKSSFGGEKLELGLTGPLGELPVNYRFDFAHTAEAGYRQAPQRRNSGVLALEWQPFDQLSALYRGQVARDRYDNPDPGIPVDTDDNRVPADAPMDKNYGNPGDFLDYSGNYHQFELRWQQGAFVLANRSAISPVDYEYLEAEALDLGPDNRTISRDYLYFFHHLRGWMNQSELSWKNDNVFLKHGLIGFDLHRFDFSSERDSALDYSGYALPDTDLYEPDRTRYVVTAHPDYRRLAGVSTSSIYGQNMSDFGRVKVLLAGRNDSYERRQSTDLLNPVTQDIVEVGYVTKTSKTALTGRGGLVLEVLDGLNAYASYSTAFKPVLITDSSDGKVDWEPELGRQFEAGLKWETRDKSFSGSAAYFDIVKSNVIIRRSNSPRSYSQDGEKYSTGLELETMWRPSQRFSIKGGYSYVDARMTRFSIGSNSFVGGRPYAVPLHSANAWAEFELTKQLTFGMGGRFVGDQYADDVDNLVRMPFYALADASLRYQRESWSADLAASNLFDERRYFVSTIYGNYLQLYPGEPFKIDFTLRYTM